MMFRTKALVALVACGALALGGCGSTNLHMTEGQGLGAVEGTVDGAVQAADIAVRSGALAAATDAKIAAIETQVQKALPPIRLAYRTSDSTFATQLQALGLLISSLYAAYGATPPGTVQTMIQGQLPH